MSLSDSLIESHKVIKALPQKTSNLYIWCHHLHRYYVTLYEITIFSLPIESKKRNLGTCWDIRSLITAKLNIQRNLPIPILFESGTTTIIVINGMYQNEMLLIIPKEIGFDASDRTDLVYYFKMIFWGQFCCKNGYRSYTCRYEHSIYMSILRFSNKNAISLPHLSNEFDPSETYRWFW